MTETVSIQVGSAAATSAGGDVVVTGGQTISGWEDVSITCRCDGFPNSFSLAAATLDPSTRAATPGNPGDRCWVRIGDDTVVTGYLDQVVEGYGSTNHALSFSGRGKTCDLVDCSAEWPSGQIIGGTALTIAEKLVEPYGALEVALSGGADAGPQVPQWALDYTETPAAIIQRLAQNAGLIAYEGNDGRLLLAAVGTVTAGSGLLAGDGGNVEAASVTYSMHERFSEVVCCWYSTAITDDIAGSDFFHTEPDPNVGRHRRLDIVLAAVGGDETAEEFTKRRARWEVARRAGRALVVQATVDSWRDGGGKLWTPNTIVPVSLPGQRFTGSLLVASVTYRRDARTGTHADLVLMPKEAFAIEPISLNPIGAPDVKTVTATP